LIDANMPFISTVFDTAAVMSVLAHSQTVALPQ